MAFASILSRLFGRRRSAVPAAEEVGGRGEDLAASFLADNGYRVLERNWRCTLGEIDIVAERGGMILIVEVKSSLKLGMIPPEWRVNATKQRKLRQLARAYMRAQRLDAPIQFDVIAVWWSAGKHNIKHISNAFA